MGILQRWKLNRELKRINKYCKRKGMEEVDNAALRQIHVKQASNELEKTLNVLGKYLSQRRPESQDPEIQAFRQLQDPFYENKMRDVYNKQIRPLFA
ncbi:hypothetical protein KY309_03670 [Candidatus Woesearchaeota archaeon]|nr:hypothetical protein [Candidatus Woesearchaeota archaeon]MBW3016681.1 hypothetical protein [Candidatus Woesearchaeota archaeon]